MTTITTQYDISAQSGISIQSKYKTLAGVKREASAWLSFGAGDVTIYSDGAPVCRRRAWQSLNRYGWSKWEQV